MAKEIKKEPSFMAKEIKKEPNFMAKEIKKEPNFMAKEIKKESDFMVKYIKQEPGFMAREIKKEPIAFNKTPKSKKKKWKKSRYKPKMSKKNAKAKKKNSKNIKKSSRIIKPEKFEENKLSKPALRKKRRTERKNKKKRILKQEKKSGKNKEAKTLLDQQNNGSLRLFGFKDELEYFSSGSDEEEFKQTCSEKDTIGKRTSLTSLRARKNVILSLKSACINPFSRPQSIIQPSESKNVDILGTILKSQSLWHSKGSLMKVNEDGRVEVIKQKKNLKEIPGYKKCNQHKTYSNNISNTQGSNDPNCTLPTPVEAVSCESLNLKENTETTYTKINIKVEPQNTAETWNVETVFDKIKEEPCEKKIKIELKEEGKDLPKSPPSVSSFQEYTSFVSENIFVDSPNVEKSVDKHDECPKFSTYSEASKICSSQIYKERQRKFLPDQSEIKLIKIEGSKKSEVKENILKRNGNFEEEEKDRELKRERKISRSPSPKRKKEENKREVKELCELSAIKGKEVLYS